MSAIESGIIGISQLKMTPYLKKKNSKEYSKVQQKKLFETLKSSGFSASTERTQTHLSQRHSLGFRKILP